MKRSSKKKKDEIAETIETSSEEIVESVDNLSTEISATEAETVELSAAEIENELPETVEISGKSKNEIDTEVEEMAEKIAEVEAKDEADLKKDLPKTVEISVAKTVAAGANSGGMSASTKGFVVLAVIFALGAGLLFWSVKNAAGHGNVELNGLNKAELELLLKDANPMMLKRLAEDPEMKKKQLENLKQLFALANAAKKEGLVKDKVKKELDNVNIELTAVNYDREINKDKGQMPPFGFIGEDRVKAFWGEGQAEATGFQSFLGKIGLGEAAKYQRRQREFDEFLSTKIELAKASGQIKEDIVPSEDDIKQAREYFAKTRIYYEEAKEKMPTMSEEFKKKTNISIKLQQASYLSRLYAEKVLTEKTKVTDEDINKYIAEHPELDQSAKKTKAEEILTRVKGGEDFAKLAKEFS
nr:peptidylprolyl isomerase [Pyrinomonadaceae bacterium]